MVSHPKAQPVQIKIRTEPKKTKIYIIIFQVNFCNRALTLKVILVNVFITLIYLYYYLPSKFLQ